MKTIDYISGCKSLGLDYIYGPFGGLEIKLVGGQTLQIAGDKVRIRTEVAIAWLVKREEFLNLDNDVKDVVMRVHWYQRVTNSGRK